MIHIGTFRLVAVALAGWAAASCGGGNPASQLATAPEFDPEGQTKCSIAKSQARPLIVEWPSADRGDLEAQARKGLVAVRYSGCEMEVQRHCQVPGHYDYAPFTRKDDRITMRDADELYANVPLGAVKLEAKLAKAGELNVSMAIVGKYEAAHAFVDPSELQGECSQATHLISAVTVGAFELFAGAAAEVGGGIEAGTVGVGARSVAQRELLNRDGDPQACARASLDDERPPDGCGAFLRVEVVPLEAGGRSSTASATAPAPDASGSKSTVPGATDAAAEGAAPTPKRGHIAVTCRSAQSVAVAARDADGQVLLRTRPKGGNWSAWRSLGGKLHGSPALVANRDGRMEVCGVDVGGSAQCAAEQRPGGPWGSWQPVGGPKVTGRFALQQTSKGYLAAFVRDASGGLQHIWQTKPGSGWSKWLALGGTLASDPVVVLDSQQRLVVFARFQDGALWTLGQEKPYGGWRPWVSLGGKLSGRPQVIATRDGALNVLARGADGRVWRLQQPGPDGTWGPWQQLGPKGKGALPDVQAAPLAGGGQQLVMARHGAGVSQAILSPSAASWPGWQAASGLVFGELQLVPNGSGVELVARGIDGEIWQRTYDGSSWGSWHSLGVPR